MSTLLLGPKTCECCGSTGEDVAMRPARTAYRRSLTPQERRYYEAVEAFGGGPVPICADDEVANRAHSLCDECEVEDAEHWGAMWDEHYAGLGV